MCLVCALCSDVCTCVCQVPVWVLGRGDRHMEDIMTGEAAMTRIRDTPVVRPAIPNQAINRSSNQTESPRPIGHMPPSFRL
jgi:formate hydrogenlyase subunit 6/NADH:ubiquinone oxidoreductase subunit I